MALKAKVIIFVGCVLWQEVGHLCLSNVLGVSCRLSERQIIFVNSTEQCNTILRQCWPCATTTTTPLLPARLSVWHWNPEPMQHDRGGLLPAAPQRVRHHPGHRLLRLHAQPDLLLLPVQVSPGDSPTRPPDRVDLCWPVLTCVDLCWPVLTCVYLCFLMRMFLGFMSASPFSSGPGHFRRPVLCFYYYCLFI